MMILTKCGVAKLSYLLRCTPPPCMRDQAVAMDKQVLGTAAHLLDLTNHQRQKLRVTKQLQAPWRHGGYGLTSAVDSAQTAYYSSVLSCSSMPHIQQELQSWSAPASDQTSSDSRQSSMLHQHIDQCISGIRATIAGPDSELIRSDLVPSSASEIIPHYQQHAKVKPFVQQEVTAIAHKLQRQAALTEAERQGDQATQARLLAVSAPGASVWLDTAPTTPALSLTNTQYQISSKIRLGLPPLPLPSDCASCHTEDACAADPLHPLVCAAQTGRLVTTRHHQTVDALYVSAIHAGGIAIKEPRDLSDKGDQLRPDIQLMLNGKQYLVDVTIRHPVCQTNIQRGSAVRQLAAARHAEKEKKAKYADMAKTQQASFVPFAVETHGGLGKSARKLMSLIASVAEDRQQGMTKEEMRKELRGAVAIAVQKGNANVMLGEYCRAMGAATRADRGLAASTA